MIMWKYLGYGFIAGIPARDLTKDEFSKMSSYDQDTVRGCGLYSEVKEEKAVKTAKEK